MRIKRRQPPKSNIHLQYTTHQFFSKTNASAKQTRCKLCHLIHVCRKHKTIRRRRSDDPLNAHLRKLQTILFHYEREGSLSAAGDKQFAYTNTITIYNNIPLYVTGRVLLLCSALMDARKLRRLIKSEALFTCCPEEISKNRCEFIINRARPFVCVAVGYTLLFALCRTLCFLYDIRFIAFR